MHSSSKFMAVAIQNFEIAFDRLITFLPPIHSTADEVPPNETRCGSQATGHRAEGGVQGLGRITQDASTCQKTGDYVAKAVHPTVAAA